jgi:hypothetical protein
MRRNRAGDGMTVTTDLQISEHPPFNRDTRKERARTPRDH